MDNKIILYSENKRLEIRIELRLNNDKKYIFSASGFLREKNEYGIYKDVSGGQLFDDVEVFECFKDAKMFLKIYKLWKKYHLNDMHAGTQKQEEFLKKHNFSNWANNYTETCQFLEKHNLLYDNGYKFGSSCLLQEIPLIDIEVIKDIILNK